MQVEHATNRINALGEACPLPVVRTKRALAEMESGTLLILVDNFTAVDNLRLLAQSKDVDFRYEKMAESLYHVHMEKTEAADQGAVEQDEKQPETSKQPRDVRTVVVISSEVMGQGDDALGAILMKGFVFALTQLDTLPETVLLYNGGARLSVQGSASFPDLEALHKAGVSIRTCGTCLNHFGIADELAVGDVTNMYTIVETIQAADRVIRP